MSVVVAATAFLIGAGVGAASVAAALVARHRRNAASVSPSDALGRLEHHVDNAPLAVIEWDENFRITGWGPRAVEIFGWTPEEVVGRHFDEFAFVHEDDAAAVGKVAVELTEGRVDRNTSRNRNYRKDGSIIHCQWSNSARTGEHGTLVSLLSFVDDITASVEAAATIQQQRDELQLVFDTIQEGIWDWDLEADTIEYSDRLSEILGVAPGDGGGMPLASVTHPDDLERRKARFGAHLEHGETYLVEYRMRKADGTYIWVSDSGQALRRPDGRAYRMVGSITDVTSRKRVEAALRAERDLLDGIMRTSVAAITVVNTDGEITFANDAAEHVLGLEKQTIEGLSYAAPTWRITDFDGKPYPEERLPFQRVMRTGEPVFDVRHAIVWPNGERKLLSINGAPLRDDAGKIVDVVCLVDDITHRVHAEVALRQSEANYRTLVEGSPQGIHQVDGEGRIIAANQAARSMLDGEGEHGLVGQRIVDLVASEDRGRMDGYLVTARTHDCGFECRLPDGRTLDCSIVPLPDRVDGSTRLMWLTTDITERRASEARQQLMMAELDHRVKNMLASMVSLAEQTATGTYSLEEFLDRYIGRLRSLARTHEALAATKWSGIDLGEVVQLTVLPYADTASGNITVAGDEVRLPPEAAAPVCLSFHELTTNAIKHGSLSSGRGHLDLRWHVEADRVLIDWIERSDGSNGTAQGSGPDGTRPAPHQGLHRARAGRPRRPRVRIAGAALQDGDPAPAADGTVRRGGAFPDCVTRVSCAAFAT